MLLDCSEQTAVFAHHLCGRCDAAILKLVMVLAKAAFGRQHIEHVLNACLVGFRPERHINLFDDAFVHAVLRQCIEGNIIRIKCNFAIKVLCNGRLDHNPLFAQHKLIHIAVIRNINTFELVYRVRKNRNSHWVIPNGVISNIQSVKNKLPVRRPCVYNGRNVGKFFNIRQADFLQGFRRSPVQDIVNVIQAVHNVVNLAICIWLAFNGSINQKSTFQNFTIFP